MIEYNQILPGLFVGSYPGSQLDIDKLQEASRITAVLNLQMDEDMEQWGVDWPRLVAYYQKRGIVVQRVPIRDVDPFDLLVKLADAVRALNLLLAANHTVYVHCTVGVGRAPSVAIAYLHWCRGWELTEAATYVRERRSCSPSVEAIGLATLGLLSDAAIRCMIESRMTEMAERHSQPPKDHAQLQIKAQQAVLQEILSKP
jgi:hypothetical protein